MPTMTTRKRDEGRLRNLPSKECIECKLYRAFVTCFGITVSDMRRQGFMYRRQDVFGESCVGRL